MTADDLDHLVLDDPKEYERYIRSFNHLAGNGESPSEDLRITSIPQTRHLDRRRYTLGLDRLTAYMGAIRSGELVVVGAREGHGKTAFAERFALENSLKHRVLFTTLEMTREEIRDRMLAKIMHTTLDVANAAREEDSEDFCTAMADLQQRDLMIWHPRRGKDRRIEAITKRAVDVSAALLVIDYTRVIDGWRPGDDAARIVDVLGDFVRTTFITTVLLAQLNREAALRRPHTGNYQDTGKLEQAADRALLLWRPFLGNPRKDRLCEVIVAKNRHGPAFRGHAGWVGQTMDYYDYTDEQDAMAECCHKRKGQTE